MAREKTITTNIKDLLESIPEIQKIIPRPLGENETLSEYPCAIFYPESSDSSFESVTENIKTYRYKLFLIVGLTNDTADNIFLEAIPTLVDAVEDKIDNGWDMGTMGGSRVWAWIDGGTSGISAKTNEAYRELNINVRLLKTNS